MHAYHSSDSSQLTSEPRTYHTLDDIEVLGTAQNDPFALIQLPGRLTIDEVQRAPDFLLAIKRAIDLDRVAGRFLLTGSANLLLMRRVSESLAGRASYLTLWPMARREQLGLGRAGRWSELLATPHSEWRALLSDASAEAEPWHAFAERGGFPTPALGMSSATDRRR